MSFGSKRLNRAIPRPQPLRPQLQSGKDRLDQQHKADAALSSHPVPVTGAKGPAIPVPPYHSVASAYPTDYGMDQADADVQVYDPAKSTARTWGLLLVVIILLAWGAGFVVGFQAALGGLLAIGLVLCVAGLFSPGLGILAIGMVAALDAMANIFLLTGGVLRFNTLNYWLLIVMALYIPFILRLKDLNSRTLQVFLLLLLLELSFSSNISTGVQDILNIGVTFGMVVYFARALKDELALYWLGIVVGVLAGLGGLVFFLQMQSLPYANPNDYTYFNLTALFAICVSYRFAIKYNQNRLILLALAAVNVAWIFLSGSRGSLLVAALAAAYLFLSTRSITWKSVMVVVAALVALWVSTTFADLGITTISRIQLLFDPNVSAVKRTSKRSVIAEAGLRIFQQNPMGIGTGSFAEESITTGLLASQRPAHSAWIKVLAENGVLGILLMTTFILSFTIAGFRKHQEGALLFALFLTLTLASAFIAKEFRGKSLWFLTASGIVLLHPEEMLAFMQRKAQEGQVDLRQRLRKVRYGSKR